MKYRIIIAIVLVAVLAVCLAGCAQNSSYQVDADKELLAVGNLEKVTDGKLEGWTLTTGDNAANPTLVSIDKDSAAYDPAYGTRFARISANVKGSYTFYSQQVKLERGAVYRLSASIRVTSSVIAGGTRSAYVGLKEYAYIFDSLASSGEWKTASVYFRNDATDAVTVVWGLGSEDSLATSGTAQFDNISLVKLSDDEAEQVIALSLKDGNGRYDTGYAKTVKDTVYLVLTTVLFALLAALAFFAIKHFINKDNTILPEGGDPAPQGTGKNKFWWSPTLWLVVSLLVGFGIRLALSLTVFGYGPYGNQVASDAAIMAEKGLFRSYVDIANVYAPGANYLLYIMGLIAIPLHLTQGTLGMAIFLKIPSILADLVLTVVLFSTLAKEKGVRTATVASLLFAVCPVTFAASGVWGTFTPVGVLFLVLALLAARNRHIVKLTVFYGLSVLFMPEALLLLPLLVAFAVVTYIKCPETRIKIPVAATVAIVAGYALTVPLAIDYYVLGRPFIVLERYITYFTQNGYFARNIFGLYGMVSVGADTLNTTGKVFSAIFAVLVLSGGIALYAIKRNRQDLILAAGWSLAGVLVLCAHQDMWLVLPVLVVLGLYSLIANEKRVGLAATLWAVLATLNVGYALWVGGNVQGGLGSTSAVISSSDPVLITFSVLTVLVFGYLTYVAIDVCILERKLNYDPISNSIERCKKLLRIKDKEQS